MGERQPATWERSALQVCVALGGLVPFCAGLAGALFGVEFLGEQARNIALDSHTRYLSGLLLGIGLAFWSTVPNIARRTARFRLLTAIVAIGGLARLYGLIAAGLPDRAMQAALIMELAVTPLLCLWQARIARLPRPDATS